MDIILRGEEDKREDLVTDKETRADENYVINPEWEKQFIERFCTIADEDPGSHKHC